MPITQLTSSTVASLPCPAGRGKVEYTDSGCRGLILEVRQSGGRTYYLRYTDHRGRQRQYRIGDANCVSLRDARQKANSLRGQILLGHDPREEKAVARSVPTFGAFVDQQYMPYVKSYKRSWETDWSIFKNHLIPRFAKRHMDEITRQDIIKMLADRKAEGAAPGSVNRLLIMMRYAFNLAVRWDIPGVKVNPTKGVPLLEENNKRERYLSTEEAQRLYDAVCASQNPMLRYIVPMLILTGARKREVLDARWEDFNIERRVWRIPMTKTGKARHVPLSDGAIGILTEIARVPGCAWAFANPDTGKPYVSIFSAWNTARRNAGLSDVRIHDLRHSFASLLINQGRTLYEVQHLLGHTQVKTTQRYAHLSQDTLLAAANAASVALGNFFAPPTSTATSAVGAVMLPP
jgi:integrase